MTRWIIAAALFVTCSSVYALDRYDKDLPVIERKGDITKQCAKVRRDYQKRQQRLGDPGPLSRSDRSKKRQGANKVFLERYCS